MRPQPLLRLFEIFARYDRPARVFRAVIEPRKPRHRMARVLLAVTGVVVLGVLAVAAIAIGAVMILGGIGWRLLRRSPTAAAPRDRVLDGDYRVVPRAMLSR
ncbi:hypothetical protein GCM10008101_02760 [Lysobacter xinjiangensis]|jgi:hypothetical protein|uniref:Uncharacterized protein n=1 Tax=Cognatilysobacter xinjiangensis TaxID=546892 RepID=A0ABQ3BP52_9GAMM|nr:hypothetical protein [Lysobacter xinjiangensis]GGZ53068.1 hypothetical protein GCM10008101_02760 [Lysobacter xinjiangensis]